MSQYSVKAGNSGSRPKSQKGGRQNGQVATKELDDPEKNELKRKLELQKRENMMLRKNLNMLDIMEELKKTVAVNNMEQMFFESLHELQFRLQQYESDSGASESLKVKDLQKELDRQKVLIESIRREVHLKNTKINDLERSLDDSKKKVETLTNQVTVSSQTNSKLQREKATFDSEKKLLSEEITILKAANTALRNQVTTMEQENEASKRIKMMSLSEEMSEIEKLRQELRERDQTIGNQREQIQHLETDIISTKRLFQETEASLKVLESTTSKQNDRLGDLNKDKEQLYVENEILMTDLNNIKSKCEEQSSQINDLEEELERTVQSNKLIEDEMSRLRDTNTNSESIIKELQEQYTKGIVTNDSGDNALKEELTKVKVENELLKRKKEELEFTCHEAFEKITQGDKKMKAIEDEYKKTIAKREETIQKLRKEMTIVDPTKSNATIAEVNALKDKIVKLSKELADTNTEIALLKKL
ncbi:hypothetical protein ACF0H5_011118 [Mactra antiquata]